MRKLILSVIVVVFFTGCATAPAPAPPKAHAPVIKMADNQDRPTLETSLLRSDQEVLSEKAINTILSSRVVLPRKGHLTMIKFPGTEGGTSKHYGRDYWRSEAYLKTQQDYIDTLSDKLASSERVAAVTLLPSLLTPKDATIPVLREAAARLQADLLLVFRITSDIYQQSMWLEKDKVKAFSTCEAVLLDVKTGLIPYITVTTRESLQQQKTTDSDINETRRRAEKEAVLASVNAVANELVKFFKSVP